MKSLTKLEERRLVAAAKAAMKNAYSPYSKVKVGAAIIAEDGRVFSGCNVENSSYGLSICAERVAAAKAVSEGARSFRAAAITSNLNGIAYPCGACRQVLMEFGPDMVIVLFDKGGDIERFELKDLLSHPFRL